MAGFLTRISGKQTLAIIASADVTTALATPPAIGGTTAAAGSFTTLSTSGTRTVANGVQEITASSTYYGLNTTEIQLTNGSYSCGLRVGGADGYVIAYNKNDNIGGGFWETYNTLYFGSDNGTGRTAIFAINFSFYPSVGTIVPSSSAGYPVFRNLLDDGKGNFSLNNVVAATSSANVSSGTIQLQGAYYNASSASTLDNWTLQNIVGTGTTPTSILTIAHSGSTGTASLNVLAGISATTASAATSSTNQSSPLFSLGGTYYNTSSVSVADQWVVQNVVGTGTTPTSTLTVTHTGSTGATSVSIPAGLNTTPIGVTTPAAGKFTTLAATGASTLTTVAASGLITGTASATITGSVSATTFVKSAGLQLAIATKTAAYTVVVTDYTILCSASSAAFTVTLPSAPTTGEVHVFKKIDTSTNVVTVAGNGKNVEGAANYSLSSQNAVVWIQYDGTAWWIL